MASASSSTQPFLDTQEVVAETLQKVQRELGDCLPADYVPALPKIKQVIFKQRDLTKVREIWSNTTKRVEFEAKYGHLASLLSVPVDESLLKALVFFWDPAYRVFSFRDLDLTPTLEEYAALLKIKSDGKWKEYIFNPSASPHRQLARIMGIKAPELESVSKEKGENWCVSIDLILSAAEKHIDTEKGFSLLALAIYGLVLFPKVEGYIDMQVILLFSQTEHGIHPVPPILSETFRSLCYLKQKGEGRFIGCAQLLTIWAFSHLPTMTDLGYPQIKLARAYFPQENNLIKFSNLAWPENRPTRNTWINALAKLEEVKWKAIWMPIVPILYRCGSNAWVPLMGPRGIIGYAPTMVMRQIGAVQCIPATQGLHLLDVSYGDESFPKTLKAAIDAWKSIRHMEPSNRDTTATTEGYPRWQMLRAKGFIPLTITMPTTPKQSAEEPQPQQEKPESEENRAYRSLQLEHEKACEGYKEKQAEWEREKRQMTQALEISERKVNQLKDEVEKMKIMDKEEAVRYRKETRNMELKIERANKRCKQAEQGLQDARDIWGIEVEKLRKENQELKAEIFKIRKEGEALKVESLMLKKENQRLKTTQSMNMQRIRGLEDIKSQLTSYVRDSQAQHEEEIQELQNHLCDLQGTMQNLENVNEQLRHNLVLQWEGMKREMINNMAQLDPSLESVWLIAERDKYERMARVLHEQMRTIAQEARMRAKEIAELALPDGPVETFLWNLYNDLTKLGDFE